MPHRGTMCVFWTGPLTDLFTKNPVLIFSLGVSGSAALVVELLSFCSQTWTRLLTKRRAAPLSMSSARNTTLTTTPTVKAWWFCPARQDHLWKVRPFCPNGHRNNSFKQLEVSEKTFLQITCSCPARWFWINVGSVKPGMGRTLQPSVPTWWGWTCPRTSWATGRRWESDWHLSDEMISFTFSCLNHEPDKRGDDCV